jgi:hypothetical protein
MRWPGILLAGAELKAYSAQVDAFAVHLGVTASLVIACFAIPVSAILARRAAALPRTGEGGTPDDPGLFDKGMLGSLGKVLIVLAPSLAGIIPTLVEAAGNLH